MINIGSDHFLIGVQGKEVLVEATDMVAGFYGKIVFAIARQSFQYLTGREDINAFLCQFHRPEGLVDDEDADAQAAQEPDDAEAPDMAEGGLGVMCSGEYGWHF